MKKILMIGTGGTIASVESPEGLTPSISGSDLLHVAPEIGTFCKMDCMTLLNLDSTNIQPEHWMLIAKTIKENYEKYDGFVVTHGTDTMAYTAAGLSYLIQNNRKPVVITGSQKPVGEPGSDAKRNIVDAFLCACDENSHGIQIVFSSAVIAGTRARKNFSKSFAAFGSINFPELARIQDGRVVRFITEDIRSDLRFYDRMNTNVGLLKLVPGLRKDVMEFIIDQYDGIVVESFGVGGLPEYSNFYGVIKSAIDAGKLVVMTTQVPNEGSNLSVYKVGTQLKSSLRILEAHDMTTESAFAKLMWILGQTSDFDEAYEMFHRCVGHDMLYH